MIKIFEIRKENTPKWLVINYLSYEGDKMKNIKILFYADYSELFNYLYISAAARTLNGSAFKLFIYLFEQIPNQEIIFSASDFIRDFGGGYSSVKRSLEELIKNNFLQQQDTNIFLFTPNQNG